MPLLPIRLQALTREQSDTEITSGTSTPCTESSSSSIVSCPNTPSTSRSLLFEEFSITGPSDEDTNSQDRVLIVGGLGYIGSHTTLELLKAGHNVVIIDNLSNAYLTVLERLRQMTKNHFKGSPRMPRIEFFEADYRESQTMSVILSRYAFRPTSLDGRTSQITGVIHFAAYKAVTESIKQPLKYYANNVAGLVDFCSLLNNFAIKTFIFSSSATVYGELANRGGKLPEELCTHETTTWKDSNGKLQLTNSGCTGLTNPYGRTKWMCEAILNDLAVSDPEWKVFALRYFNPVGCDESGLLGEDPRTTPNNLMPILVEAMTGQRPRLDIFGSDWDTVDGTAVRDFIHVSDLARGHVAALETATRAGAARGFQAINLGTGNGQTIKEVIGAMESVIGRKIPTKMIGRREGDVGVCIAETSKANGVLGWKAERTIGDSCRDIARFLKLMPGEA